MKRKGRLARALQRRLKLRRQMKTLPEPQSMEELARACMQGPPQKSTGATPMMSRSRTEPPPARCNFVYNSQCKCLSG